LSASSLPTDAVVRVDSVTAVGSSVQKLAIGDRALVSCVSSCGSCRYCRHGSYGQRLDALELADQLVTTSERSR